MNSEKRKVFSYCMVLLLAFTTVFQGSFVVGAATLKNDDKEVTTSNEYFTITTNEKGQTVYTLKKNVKDGLELTLENGESAILEGNGKVIGGKDATKTNRATLALRVSGNGTLTIKNATLNGGEHYESKVADYISGAEGVVVERGCNLILDQTVTIKGKEYNDSGTIYNNTSLEFNGNQLVMKEKSKITIGESKDNRPLIFVGELLDVEDNVSLNTGTIDIGYGSIRANIIISKNIDKSKFYNDVQGILTNLTIKSWSNGKELKEDTYWQLSEKIYRVNQLPVLDASKYELKGWYTDAAMANPLKDETKITGDTTIYANYNQIAGDVTFQSNGGSQVAKERVKFGGKAKQPANPTKSGYTFKGWYTDGACTSAYDFNESVSRDITLYAKWEKASQGTVKKSITKATVSKIKSVTYSGFYKKPSVTVRYAGKKLKNGRDYTLSYKNNKKVGKATVTIKGRGSYTGTKKVTFKIKTRKKGVYAKGIYKVDAGGLAGHKKASSKSKVIAHYSKGKKLEVTKVIRKKTPKKTYVWLKVKYKGKTSYIYGKYVK